MANIKNLLGSIDSIMGSINVTAPLIPPVLIQCGVLGRPGLSKINTIQNIVKSMAAGGLPITDNPDGTPNDAIIFASAISNSIIEEITKRGVVQIPFQMGEVTITLPGIFT